MRPFACASRAALAWLACAIAAPAAGAQEPGNPARAEPLRPRLGWSPLERIADPGRVAAPAVTLPDLLSERPPAVSFLAMTGNPGAAAIDGDSTTLREFRSEHARLSGEFRRPLDPREVTATSLSTQGRARLGRRGIALGHARLARRGLQGGTFALGVEPYSASPLVPTDTTEPEMHHSAAMLEGVLGWRLGSWGIGVSSGVEVTDARASGARIGRIGRVAMPAVALGIVRELPGSLRAGAYARGSQRMERLSTVPLVAPEVVHQLEGMFEVEPRVLGNTPYFRRFERRAGLGGISLGGTTLGAEWVAFHERAALRERQSSAEQADPPADEWSAWSTRSGAAAQRSFGRGQLVATVFADLLNAGGDATRSDLDGRIYRSEANVMRLAADLRARVAGSWDIAVVARTTRDERRVDDALARLGTEVTAWNPGGAFEIARAASSALRVSLGVGVSMRAPVASIPQGDSLGPIFRQLIAPELEWNAAGSRSEGVAGTVRWSPGSRELWMRIGGTRVVRSAVEGAPEYVPTGSRSSVTVGLGASL